MAKAVQPRPGRQAGIFGAYLLLVVVLAYLLAPSVAPHVWPAATRWILATYVLLGALALVGIGAGAVRRAATLDAHLDELEFATRWRRETVLIRKETVIDSGSAEVEVEALLSGLQKVSEAASIEETRSHADGGDLAPVPFGNVLRDRARQITLTARVRRGVPRTVAGPAAAAIALVGFFATYLPAADGLLLSDLNLNAFLGLLGIGWLAGLAVYGGAAFRSLRPPIH